MPNVALSYIGDGGTSTTDFHEGVNFAAVHKVPFILVDGRTQPVGLLHPHHRSSFPCKDLAEKATEPTACYSEIFDGNNILRRI